MHPYKLAVIFFIDGVCTERESYSTFVARKIRCIGQILRFLNDWVDETKSGPQKGNWKKKIRDLEEPICTFGIFSFLLQSGILQAPNPLPLKAWLSGEKKSMWIIRNSGNICYCSDPKKQGGYKLLPLLLFPNRSHSKHLDQCLQLWPSGLCCFHSAPAHQGSVAGTCTSHTCVGSGSSPIPPLHSQDQTGGPQAALPGPRKPRLGPVLPCMPILAFRTMVHGAVHRSMGSPADQMTWHQSWPMDQKLSTPSLEKY